MSDAKFRNYHAVFRREGEKIPSSVEFMADNPTDAINVMCDKIGVHSTNSVAEFQILEVLGPNRFAEAAIKVAKSRSVGERIARVSAAREARPAISSTVETKTEPAKPVSEKKYIPYTCKAA